jgi:ribosomal protein S18 acetylase RimI-like enzyme
MDSKVTIRPALTSDLPAIALLHIEAHPNHPMTRLAWSHPLDVYPIFLARCNLIISLPYYHFLVATSCPVSPLSSPKSSVEDIIGFVIWKDGYDIDGGEERQEPEFKPEFPPTANLGFMASFQGQNAAHEKTLSIEGMGELELLDVRPSRQRKGVGALLLEAALKEVSSFFSIFGIKLICYLV